MIGALAGPSAAYQRPGSTEEISVTFDGSDPNVLVPILSSHQELCINNSSGRLSDITADGRYIAFASWASNIVPGDTNQICDVFVRDRRSGTTDRVSVTSNGEEALGVCKESAITLINGSNGVSISSNGRYVAFVSCALNLVPGDTNLGLDIFVRDRRKQQTVRASVSSSGEQTEATNFCFLQFPAISGNGRFVAFETCAPNLVEDDTNDATDVFVRDLRSETTVRASIANDGSEGQLPPTEPFGSVGQYASLSDDGRFVMFASDAALTPGDTNLQQIATDIYVRDLVKQSTARASVASDGAGGMNGSSGFIRGGRQISADGNNVVFASYASNLVPSDTSSYPSTDVFVHNRVTGRTERVSVLPSGAEAKCEGGSQASISGDGRAIIFTSACADFSTGKDTADPHAVPILTIPTGLPGSDWDVYVHDRVSGALTWASVAPDGTEAKIAEGCKSNEPGSIAGAATHTGATITFTSCADNVSAGDKDRYWDVFTREVGPSLGIGGLSGSQSVSIPGDRSFSSTGAVLATDAIDDVANVLTDRGANLFGASLAYRPQYEDLFVRIQLEDMPYGHGMSLAGDPAILYGLDLTANDTRFQIRAQRFASDSIAGLDPVQLAAGGASFGLFRCNADAPLCTKVTSLKGGYGTTGVEVVVALPLSSIGLEAGGQLSGLEAFTAFGSYDLGSVKTLDKMTLPD